jgi:hypothetical protein
MRGKKVRLTSVFKQCTTATLIQNGRIPRENMFEFFLLLECSDHKKERRMCSLYKCQLVILRKVK